MPTKITVIDAAESKNAAFLTTYPFELLTAEGASKRIIGNSKSFACNSSDTFSSEEVKAIIDAAIGFEKQKISFENIEAVKKEQPYFFKFYQSIKQKYEGSDLGEVSKVAHMIIGEKAKEAGIELPNREETIYNAFVDYAYEAAKKHASDIETFMKQTKPPYKLDILGWTANDLE